MLKREKNKEELNIKKINNTISLFDKILKIVYILTIIVAFFLLIKV